VAGEYGPNAGYKIAMSHCLVRVCYKYTDLEAMIVHPPDVDCDIFYCIPTPSLAEDGIVESPTTSGKKPVTIYVDDVLSRIDRTVDTWANQYIFRYDTPNLRSVLIEFIRCHTT
jgi:hypothetical protein